VRAEGTEFLVPSRTGTWFTPAFAEHRPDEAARLLAMLRATRPDGYAACCAALAEFDVRDRLHEISAPTLVIAGAGDPATTVDMMRLLADGITAMDRGCLSDAVQLLHGALAGLGLHATAAAVPAVPPTAIRDPARTALAARILLSLAFLHHELGDSADALRAFDNAEALAAQGRHAEIEVLIHAQRGAMFLREGRLAESLAELDVAVAMLDFAPAVDQGKILINRGEAHGLLGQIAAAKADCG